MKSLREIPGLLKRHYEKAIVALALVLAVKAWGLVALTLTALCLVPVMFVLLIAISRP